MVITSKPECGGAVRYTLRLPAIFRWDDGVDHVEGGFTEEIGQDTALVFSSKCPPVGSDICIEVLVPLPEICPRTLRIEAAGKVTEIIQFEGYTGFRFQGRFTDEQINFDRL